MASGRGNNAGNVAEPATSRRRAARRPPRWRPTRVAANQDARSTLGAEAGRESRGLTEAPPEAGETRSAGRQQRRQNQRARKTYTDQLGQVSARPAAQPDCNGPRGWKPRRRPTIARPAEAASAVAGSFGCLTEAEIAVFIGNERERSQPSGDGRETGRPGAAYSATRNDATKPPPRSPRERRSA